MPKLNKTIVTSTKEQLKSAVILTLVVGMAAFFAGVQYQKNAKITVENKVVVESTQTTVETKK